MCDFSFAISIFERELVDLFGLFFVGNDILSRILSDWCCFFLFYVRIFLYMVFFCFIMIYLVLIVVYIIFFCPLVMFFLFVVLFFLVLYNILFLFPSPPSQK